MSVLGFTRHPRARKQHVCFLCPLPISVGEVHPVWTWKGDGAPSQMRAHEACDRYARDRVDGWTDGDGVDENAVATDIYEQIRQSAHFGDLAGVDEPTAAEIVKSYPELTALMAHVRAEIAAERGA